MAKFPQFRPSYEQLGKEMMTNWCEIYLEFPGEIRQNFLVIKGPVQATVN